MTRIFIFITLVALALKSHAEVFKCTLESGKMVYQSESCGKNSTSQSVLDVKAMTPEESAAARERLQNWQQQQSAEDAARAERDRQQKMDRDRQESLSLQRRSVAAQEQQAVSNQQQNQNYGGNGGYNQYGGYGYGGGVYYPYNNPYYGQGGGYGYPYPNYPHGGYYPQQHPQYDDAYRNNPSVSPAEKYWLDKSRAYQQPYQKQQRLSGTQR